MLAWSLLLSRSPDTVGYFHPLLGPDQDCQPRSLSSAGARSPQTGGHCPSQLGPDPAAANRSGAQGHLGPAWPYVCCGEVFVPRLPGETHILLGTLSSVPVMTPQHLRPACLGGAWKDKASFGCLRPGGQSASACRPDREIWKAAWQPCHAPPDPPSPHTFCFCHDMT